MIIQSYDWTDIVTYDEGLQSDYESFDYSGDVILYYKYGDTEVTPIIHMAMYRVDTGDPIWTNGPPECQSRKSDQKEDFLLIYQI